MTSPSFSVEPGNGSFNIFHRKKTNCALEVTTDYCGEIGEPQLLQGGWAIPCDVVGLGTKKAKTVKIRFHPSVRQLCSKNPKVHEAACRDAIKYLDALLEDSEWTRKMQPAEDRYAAQLKSVTEELDTTKTIVDVTPDSIIVSWCFSDRSPSTIAKKPARSRTAMSAAALAFFNSFAHSLIVKVKELDDKTTEVWLTFEKEDFAQPLAKLVVDTDFIMKLGDNVVADVKCIQGLVMWSVKRSYPDDVGLPQSLPATLDYQLKVNGQWKHAEASINQMLLKRLKREVDESLDALAKSALSQNLAARILNIIKNPMGSSSHTLVEVTQTGGTPQIAKLTAQATAPLNISIDNLDSGSDSDQLATSPAESVDSGVSMSPISSPTLKTFGACMRERSYSESTWGSSPPIKGILKRSNRWDRFCRSVSECLEDEPNNTSPVFLPRSPTFETSEDDDDVIDRNETSPLGSRKKRVSFSDSIQKHLFKSTQSIESQKRKNQKRREQKKRKEGKRDHHSRRCSDTSGDELFEPSCSSYERPGVRTNREDSGFMDGEESDSTWQAMVKKMKDAVKN